MDLKHEHPQQEHELEINLLDLAYRLLERARVIILAAVIGALVMAVYAFQFTTPSYTATTKLYVLNSKESAISLSDLQIGTQLASDYKEVFSNWHVHEMVLQRLNLDYTYNQLDAMIDVKNPTGTRILYISVTTQNADEAKRIADTYAQVAQEFIAAKMETEMPNIFEEALRPSRPSSTSRAVLVALGFLLGAFVAACAVVVHFLVDDRIRTGEQLEKNLGLAVLGMMPEEKRARSGRGGERA